MFERGGKECHKSERLAAVAKADVLFAFAAASFSIRLLAQRAGVGLHFKIIQLYFTKNPTKKACFLWYDKENIAKEPERI